MDLRLERRAWTLVYLCLGVVEGATAAVMVRSLFAGQVGGIAVDLVLALVAAAPAWANLASLAYARAAQGRPKVAFLQPLLLAMAICVASLALLPRSGAGLVAFFVIYSAARLLWAGVETVRAVVWSVNYPRHMRARMTGSIMVAASLALASAGLALGWLLERPEPAYRVLILGVALCGVAGALVFRQLRVRREQQLLDAERARLVAGASFDLRGMRELLQRDPSFRRYMYAMSLFGAGNLMFLPVFVVCLDEALGLPPLRQVAITTAVPVLMMPLAIQPWARYLDRHRVIAFRSTQGWIQVTAFAVFAIAVLAGWPWLLWPGSVLYGIALAAGSLGWSLGHNDFAPRGEETRYMALHVTLTGIRGITTPMIGIALFYLLEHARPGLGPWAVLMPVGVLAAGASRFTKMNRERRRS